MDGIFYHLATLKIKDSKKYFAATLFYISIYEKINLQGFVCVLRIQIRIQL